jgi:4-carboxymuconolactone decarboxylase
MGSTFGRYGDPPGEDLSEEQRTARDALLGGFRDRVSGPFTVWLTHPALTVAIAALDEHLNSERFRLAPGEREIAILVVAVRLRAPFVVQAHRTRAIAAGVPAGAVEAIADGRPAELPRERWALVRELSEALCQGGEVPEPLYRRAVDVLGHDGLSDLSLLLGYYSSVSFTMNAYGVS